MGRGGLTRARRRRWGGLAGAGLLSLLAGCGTRPAIPQELRPAPPGRFQVSRYPKLGFSLALPENWSEVAAYSPLVAVRTSDQAVIVLWSYPSRTPGPATQSGLRQAEQRLLVAARRRDPALRLISSGTSPVAGYPAVELRTVERIGHQVREADSTHVFAPGEQLVLEEYSPPNLFAGLDRSVFSTVRRSLAALKR